MAAHYLIAYDVADNKRRRRTAKIAYSYALGGQKSALESIFDGNEAHSVAQELYIKIDPHKDRINVVKVMPKAILLGRAKQLDFSEGAIIL